MDNVETYTDFQNPPIITLGDELQGILGINSTDSSIFTDILLRNKEKKDELDLEIERLLNSPKTLDTEDTPEFIIPDHVIPDHVIDSSKDLQPISTASPLFPCEPVNLASEYESLARSIVAPSPAPVIDETKKYACSLCPKRFLYRRYLNKHFSKHTNRFTCPHCQKSFARKESKIKHLPKCKVVDPECRKRKKNVVQPKEFSCEKCFQQFTRKENYDEHMLKHRGLRVLCNLCQKTFCSWKSFKLHKNKLHNFTRTVYFCEHCPAIFMFKSNLQRHLRQSENVIICSECNLTVRSENMLKKHRSQPIKRCVLCSIPFCLESHMRKHRKVLHPEIWFTCKLCDTGVLFTARSEHHLQEHVKKAHNLLLSFMECYEEGWFMNCA